MKYDRALICDYDGTIVDSAESIIAGMVSVIGKFRPDLTVDTKSVRASIGKTLHDSFKLITNDRMTEDEISAATIAYRQNHNEFSLMYSAPFVGIIDELKKIRLNGVKLYVISNKGEKALNSDLERFGIASLFEKILGDESARKKKPNPEVFNSHIKNELTENAIIHVVGDTETDIQFARNISARSIFAKYGYGNYENCIRLCPDFTVSEPSALSKLMI